MLSCLAGCAKKETVGEKTYTDFMGPEFVGSIQAGEVYDVIIEKELGTKRVNQFESVVDMLKAVDLGKVDFGVMASDSIYSHSTSGEFKNLAFTFLPPEMFTSENAQIFKSQELAAQYNEFLDSLIKSGELAEIIDFWLAGELPNAEDIPVIEGSDENGEIVFAASSGYAPMYYSGEDGKPVGFNKEMSDRFAAYLGKKPVYAEMSYGGILPYVQSGKADMSACCFSLTGTREESGVYFCKPYMSCYAAIAYRTDTATVPAKNVYGVLNKNGDYDIYNLPEVNSTKTDKPSVSELSWEDYKGKTLSMVVGFAYGQDVKEDFQTEDVQFFQDYSLMLESVAVGKTDGAFVDLTAAPIYEKERPDLTYVPVPAEFFNSPMGFICSDKELLKQFDVFLAESYENGTMEQLHQKWMTTVPDSATPMTEIINKNDPDPITAYLSELTIPFTFIGDNNEAKGYDAELLVMFANSIGRGVKVTPVEFNAILPAVVSGKADFGAAGISITAEREEMVDFSEPTYTDSLALMIRATDKAAAETAVSETAATETAAAVEKSHNPDNLTVDDIMGGTFATRMGTIHDKIINDNFKPSKVEIFEDVASVFEAVNQGKAEYAVYDTVISLIGIKEYENLSYFELPESYLNVPDAYAANFSKQGLVDEFNTYLKEAAADGTLADMKERWLSQKFDEDTTQMPYINLDDNTGETIRVALDATSPPYSYIAENNTPIGFDVELLSRFAESTNRKLELQNMAFNAVVPTINSGKADMGIGAISITDERKEMVLFTDPVYYEGAAVIYKNAQTVVKPQIPYNPDNLTVDDIMGGTFAVRLGSIYDDLVMNTFEPSKVERFQDLATAFEAISQGKLEYAVYDSVYSIQAAKYFPNLAYFTLPDTLFKVPDGYSVNFSNEELVGELNSFLAEIKANGVYDDMYERWLSAAFDENTTTMPYINLDDNTGETIRVAADATSMPFSYVIGDNVSTGFDVEFMARFAESTNRKLEVTNMPFDAILPSLQSGIHDIGVGSMTITEERAKQVFFTDPIYNEYSNVYYRLSSTEKTSENAFITYVKSAVQRNLIEDNRYKLLVNGLVVTMIITVSSMFIGTILGGGMAYFLTRKNRFAKRCAKLISGLVNGLPTVTLLMVAYYIIFGSSQISNVIIAIATFSLIMAIRIGEVLAGAIETIDPTEIEAARASGFTAAGAFMTVTLPQAVKRALSPYLTNFVSLMKETAIVGYVAIQDLMRASDIIRSRTYDAYFPLLFAAFIYLVVTTIFIVIFKAIIKRVNKKGGSEV
jgi:polar amino acid transport system substrate-binding protein